MDVIIYPYSKVSASARLLVAKLSSRLDDVADSVRFLDYETRARAVKPTDLVIGWGSSIAPIWDSPELSWINHPSTAGLAINKLHTFNALSKANVPTPEWTTVQSDAKAWARKGDLVIGRQRLTGKGGEGIVILSKDDVSQYRCPLYTRYIRPKYELRAVVLDGRVISTTRKRKRTESLAPGQEVHPIIRNYDNGWIFSTRDIPDYDQSVPVRAVEALGLAFGAVDLVVDKNGQTKVLEVNTAPGLYDDSTNTNSIVDAFVEAVNTHLSWLETITAERERDVERWSNIPVPGTNHLTSVGLLARRADLDRWL